jgi:hypothetical protein
MEKCLYSFLYLVHGPYECWYMYLYVYLHLHMYVHVD